MVQCSVNPQTLQVSEGDAFRINITIRGSPRPSFMTISNPFAAAWRIVENSTGDYTERIEMEVARASTQMNKLNRYSLGIAIQIVDGVQRTHDCIFYLKVKGTLDV